MKMWTDKSISLRLAERRAKSSGQAYERIRSCSAALETPPRHGGQDERTVWTSLLKLTTCFLKNTTDRCKHPRLAHPSDCVMDEDFRSRAGAASHQSTGCGSFIRGVLMWAGEGATGGDVCTSFYSPVVSSSLQRYVHEPNKSSFVCPPNTASCCCSIKLKQHNMHRTRRFYPPPCTRNVSEPDPAPHPETCSGV